MDNQNELNEFDELEETPEEETKESDSKSSKVELTDEEKLKRLEGGAQRLRKKLGLDEPTPKTKEAKKEEFDYAELAFIEGRGITEQDDQDFLLKEQLNTGKSLKELLGFNYIKEQIQRNKEDRTTKEATPKGGNRSTASSKDQASYWVAKINAGTAKLSDISDVKLRREVNNARIKTTEEKSKFADQSVIIG